MTEKTGMKSIVPSMNEIGFMVIRGFGLFLSVSGMVGMTLVLGPLNLIIKDMEYTLIFESKLYAFLFCLLFAIVGGALDFFANLGLKNIENQ